MDSTGGDTRDSSAKKSKRDTAEFVERISNSSFNQWFHERQVERNIRAGNASYHNPSPPQDPAIHSPSKLAQCHRKVSYARRNAPREGSKPDGFFWIGFEFEEHVIVPYLQSVATDEAYVTNSKWIDEKILAEGETLRIRGSTDPALVTATAEPLLVTEIKTTTSIDHLSEPKAHHRAQLLAYLYGLDKAHDRAVTDGLILYASRETLNIKAFHVTFDEDLWGSVVDWMALQTEYERSGELPPAEPERSWECNYCSFKHRCGQADTPYRDKGHEGLLSLFDDYDREQLEEYLAAHVDDGAQLTPTLAHRYPALAEQYGVCDWRCPACTETFDWDTVDWDGNIDDPPVCPSCLERDDLVVLASPDPHDQLTRD